MIGGTLDQITFPVSQYQSVFNLRPTNMQALHVRDPASPVRALAA